MTLADTDIQTYLGLDDTEFDSARATFLITQAQKIIAPITGDPIPDAVDPITLTVVSRAYLNAGGATNMSAGPYTAAFPAGGVYLTKAERGALARAIGLGYHFAIEGLPTEILTDGV